MTDNVELSDCEKTMMSADEPIYGDLITEIDLVDDPAKGKESLTDIGEPACEPPATETTLPTEPEFADPDALPQDVVTVSEFFTVDAKTDDFENDMIIGDLDNEGIDFKNETDVAECHHEYESKKLLFGDCEDIVEVVNSEEVETETVPETDVIVAEATETDGNEKIDGDVVTEEAELCFTVNNEESLNRMHVMEDVEEGCDVSGALPSSPGHAEQRPDPPKISPEITTTVEQTIETETTLPTEQPTAPAQNGLPAEEDEVEEEETNTTSKVVEEDEQDENKIEEKLLEEIVVETKESDEEKKEETIEAIEEEIQKDLEESEPVVEKTKDEPMITEDIKSTSPIAEPAKDTSPCIKRDNEEDSSSSESSRESTHSNKRKCEDDDPSANPAKKLRTQIQQQYANHDRILNEYIEASSCGTVEDIQVHTEQLLAEIRTLNELAREKEREWNNILHVKKVKEELLLRMQRKKQLLIMNSGDKNDLDWDLSSNDQQDDRMLKDGTTKQAVIGGNGNLMMVPVVSSSPAGSVGSRSGSKESKSDKHYSSKTRSILPKPTSMSDLNGQGECRQGRQGPILDVRSIIADYRQRHPETVPRRGRRLKSVLNTTHNDSGKSSGGGNVLSMTSLALGSGSQVRQGTAADVSNELGLLLSTMDSMRQENSRPSSADSSMASVLSSSDAAMSFKDVLVQFARLSQSERQELQAQAAASLAAAASGKPPPPPYPEVTLHPVPAVQTTPATPSTQTNSLLHGILTKTQPRVENKPTTFSPTLARLLTAPERVSSNSAQAMYTAALNSGVSISDLLSTGKSRNEITITPVGQFGQNMKHKDAEHLDEDEAEDSADRLVIDEGNEAGTGDRNRTDNGSEAGDDVPQCQGCHQKSAQFVCAGCGNQWYCSRDCQVAAWDEHSEVCSG